MAGRAQHGKGKHTPQSKTRKRRQSHPSKASQQQAVSSTTEAAAPPEKAVTPLTDMATPPPTALKHSDLLIELRRVGILAGVMLAILLTLALVLN